MVLRILRAAGVDVIAAYRFSIVQINNAGVSLNRTWELNTVSEILRIRDPIGNIVHVWQIRDVRIMHVIADQKGGPNEKPRSINMALPCGRSFTVFFQDHSTREFFCDLLVSQYSCDFSFFIAPACTFQEHSNGILERVTAAKSGWIPDDLKTACMICKERFSIANRRHHCRNCGCLVCGACSQHDAVLPAASYFEPVRVCSACFEGDNIVFCWLK